MHVLAWPWESAHPRLSWKAPQTHRGRESLTCRYFKGFTSADLTYAALLMSCSGSGCLWSLLCQPSLKGCTAEHCLLVLQDLLAEKLAEVAFLKEKHALGHRAVCLLKEKASAAAAEAEAAAAELKAAAEEEASGLERSLAQCKCDLAAARQDTAAWQRRAGMLQLKLESAEEDGAMLRTRERGAMVAARSAASIAMCCMAALVRGNARAVSARVYCDALDAARFASSRQGCGRSSARGCLSKLCRRVMRRNGAA